MGLREQRIQHPWPYCCRIVWQGGGAGRGQRTSFGDSNLKQEYNAVGEVKFQHELLGAVQRIVAAHCEAEGVDRQARAKGVRV
jgi:hypothetical protein